MGQGYGPLQQSLIIAVADSTEAVGIRQWFPIYAPIQQEYVLVTRRPISGDLNNPPLASIDELVRTSKNPAATKSALRRAARSLAQEKLVELLVCGASFIRDDAATSFSSIPVLCIRARNKVQLEEMVQLRDAFRRAETERRLKDVLLRSRRMG
jgi:hypothetical protein